jgi:dynein heavy chain
LHGKLVYFVDDLNMSAVSACGVQPPVELLRQWADHGWWADRDDLTQTKVIVDVRMVAAMNHKVLAKRSLEMTARAVLWSRAHARKSVHTISLYVILSWRVFFFFVSGQAGSFFVSSRLLRHFTVVGVQVPSHAHLLTVYGTILDRHLVPFQGDVRRASSALVKNAPFAASLGVLFFSMRGDLSHPRSGCGCVP